LYMVLKRISETKKTILMLYPDPFSGTRAEAIEAQKQLTMALNLIVSAVNKEKNNIVTLDLSTMLDSSHFDNVDIHPNAEGYKEIAKSIIEIVSKIETGEIK